MSYRNVQAVNRSNELKTDKRRLSFITSAYGIGATLVVFGHSHPLGNDAFANHEYGLCFEAQRAMRENYFAIREMERSEREETCRPVCAY